MQPARTSIWIKRTIVELQLSRWEQIVARSCGFKGRRINLSAGPATIQASKNQAWKKQLKGAFNFLIIFGGKRCPIFEFTKAGEQG